MSDLLYPLGLIESVETTKFDRTLKDDFEDGSTNARYLWAVQNFKRRFSVTHAPLASSEFRYLRSFFSARGTYDPFWFRDNVNRDGNASVRFADALQIPRATDVYLMRPQFEEVSPIRALPEWNELQTAAGFAPLFWFDPNREIYYSHAGTTVQGETSAYDAASQNFPAPWLAGSLNLGNTLGQYQRYDFTGAEYAKSASNVTALAGAQPACTLFAIVRQSTTATKQIVFAIGAAGAGTALGLQLNASNVFTPWVGSTETWATAVFTNTANTWRSIALVWTGTSDAVAMYVNGASIGSTSANARSLTAGPVVLGAAFDGTSKLNPGNAMANCNVCHASAFAGACTLAQVKAMHNLLGYQYGLATV